MSTQAESAITRKKDQEINFSGLLSKLLRVFFMDALGSPGESELETERPSFAADRPVQHYQPL
jgi:hypothetical protein